MLKIDLSSQLGLISSLSLQKQYRDFSPFFSL